MKNIIKYCLIFFCLFMITGCIFKQQENNETTINKSNEVVDLVRITINDKEYVINLEDNETVKSFVKLLPREFKMSDLNNNEKYVYLDSNLLTDSKKYKHINAGDVMLYGNNCLVIFYKSFDTSYSYTKIGHIDNFSDLGNDDVIVKINN